MTRVITYGELALAASALGARLQSIGVTSETRVAIMTPLTPETVVGLLAIWKAGAAYVPIDPSFPQDRRIAMINDSSSVALVWHGDAELSLPEDVPVICEGAFRIAVIRRDMRERDSLVEPSDPRARKGWKGRLAYVMFTSGSTGRPKAVGIEHQALNFYVKWALSAYDVTSVEGAALHSSLAFDLSITSLYPPLVAGTGVVCITGGVEGLYRYLLSAPMSVLIKVTPTHLRLLQAMDVRKFREDARWRVVVGGEEVRSSVLRGLEEWPRHCEFINEYGPTEATVGCSYYRLSSGDYSKEKVPIGKPIPQTRFQVMDSSMLPCHEGDVGELVISGPNLARGYLNDAVATAIAFPTLEETDERIYRTGDVVRVEDGDYLFLGRRDRQIKVRGYRIELDEVEAAYLDSGLCSEVAVSAASHESKMAGQMIAHVVPRETFDPSLVDRLESYLKSRFPDYMIPDRTISVESLPTTASGKLDRGSITKSLAEANSLGRAGPAKSSGEPKLEVIVSEIWAKRLGLSKVDPTDDFFALGGHSLMALRIISDISEELGARIEFADFFAARCVRELCSVIQQATQGRIPIR